MAGVKTNERPGTKAVLKYCHISAYKVRPILDLIRGKEVAVARDILRFSERDAAIVVGKLLDSAIANAAHNDQLVDPDELYVSACFADEGMTHKRWRPRARGRATRIRKRTSHVTVIVSRLPEDRLQRARARRAADTANRRARRVAGGRAGRRQRRDEQLPGTAEPIAGEAGDTVEQTVAQQDAAVEAEGTTAEATETGTTATETTDAAEAGIVDQQEAAVEQAERAADAGEAGVTEAPENTAEEAGIVDQQDAAVEATEKEEGE